MVAAESIPAQTIAPKFTGRFNKGVDYVGDVDQFAKEFNADIAVINFAVREFTLPENLKLSIHSGSDKFDELCKPYASVINIDKDKLPAANRVNKWDNRKFTSTLRHDSAAADYNINFRQLLHVGYKIAAQMGSRFTNALERHEEIIAENVTENIYQRHINLIFINK